MVVGLSLHGYRRRFPMRWPHTRWRATLRPILAGIVIAVGSGGMLPFAPVVAAIPGPALTVNVAANRFPISADIYGMNYADPALAQELHIPVDRRGGNPMT